MQEAGERRLEVEENSDGAKMAESRVGGNSRVSVDINHVAEEETPIDKALLNFVGRFGGWSNDVTNGHGTDLGVTVFESERTSGRGGGRASLFRVLADEKNGLVIKAQLRVNTPK